MKDEAGDVTIDRAGRGGGGECGEEVRRWGGSVSCGGKVRVELGQGKGRVRARQGWG